VIYKSTFTFYRLPLSYLYLTCLEFAAQRYQWWWWWRWWRCGHVHYVRLHIQVQLSFSEKQQFIHLSRWFSQVCSKEFELMFSVMVQSIE